MTKCLTMTSLLEYIKNQLNMVKVKNVKGHFKVPVGYDSWLNYWERTMNREAKVCAKSDCNNTDNLVGGHVYKKGDSDSIYLVPLCYDHNHYTITDEYEVPADMMLPVPKEDLVRDIMEDYRATVEQEQIAKKEIEE